ncbi:GerMN domain-containing protein [Pseudolysinimonas sp.]|uniref:GerMN domain-containing protein n=1 Tax=Pseudolysinimonas sp. TaxID=2680009 RepID=UPI003F7CEE28
MTRRPALAAAIGLALAAMVALAGCVTIPTGGAVGTQRISEQQGPDNGTIRAANPPRDGASPGEIVAGFVRAGGSPQGAYATAKLYLTSGSKWKPGAGTVVSDSTVAPYADGIISDSEVDYSLDLSVSAQIDATGVYAAQKPTERALHFHLVKEKGQWRIAEAPDGTVLRSRDLGVVVKPYLLYFFDPQYEFLVPDRRWFTDQGAAVSGRIVGALLAGPSPYLASPVSVSAFPAGAQLGQPVAIEAGTVTVDLNTAVLDAGGTQQARMLEQLTWSLRALDVTRVTMTANSIEVPTTEPATADGDPGAYYEAIGSDGKSFGSVSGDALAPLALGSAIEAPQPTAVSLGRDRTTAAVRGAGGVSLVTTSARSVVDPRDGLLAPSLDPLGWVWSTTSDPDSLVAVRADAKQRALPLPVTGSVVAIAMSRDGTRLLAAFDTDSGARLTVFGVQRDKDGVPVGFGTPLEVPVPAGNPIVDAAWVDGSTVATLAGAAGAKDDVVEYPLGGQPVDHGQVTDGRSLAAGSLGTGFTAVRVRLGSGELDQPSFVGDWQSTGVKLSLLGVQQ